MKTTLKDLRAAHACTQRYAFLRKALGPNYGNTTPITMQQILEHNGLDDCLWAIFHTQNGNGERLLRLFACDCAEHVLPIFERKYPKDSRPRNCIAVARGFANGEATEQERYTAWHAARDTAWHAARDAAWHTARDAAWYTAWDAETEWQANRLRELLDGAA